VPNLCQILKSYICNENFIDLEIVQIFKALNAAELYDAIVEMESCANFFFLSSNSSHLKI